MKYPSLFLVLITFLTPFKVSSLSLEEVLKKTVEENLSLRQQLMKVEIKQIENQYSDSLFDFEHSFELRQTDVNLSNSFDRSQTNELRFREFKNKNLKRFNFGLITVLDFEASQNQETTFDFSLPPGANPLNVAAILEDGLRFQKNDVRSSILRLSLVQPILRGRGNDIGSLPIKIAALDEEEEITKTRQLADELLFSITAKYIELKQKYDELKINELATKVSKETLDLANRKFEAGEINKLDLLIARQNFNETKSSKLNAESSFEQSWSELKEISETDLELKGGISPVQITKVKAAANFSQNYDLRILDTVKKKFKALIASDSNKSLDKLDFGISAGTKSTGIDKSWNDLIMELKDINEYEVSTWLEYKIPIDRRQKTKSLLQNTKNLKIVELQETNTNRKLKKVSQRIEKQLELLELQLKNSELQVTTTKEIENEVRNQFKNGLSLVKDLSEAELNARRTLLLRSVLKYRRDFLKLSLARLSGKTMKALGIEFDIMKKSIE